MKRRVLKAIVRARRLKKLAVHLKPVRLWAFAVIIGAAAAYGVIAFRWAIDAISMFAFGANELMLASGAAALSVERAWAAPVIGGCVVSAILFLADRYNWLPQGRAQAVADVIEARAVKISPAGRSRNVPWAAALWRPLP